jgi:hypothetical protein
MDIKVVNDSETTNSNIVKLSDIKDMITRPGDRFKVIRKIENLDKLKVGSELTATGWFKGLTIEVTRTSDGAVKLPSSTGQRGAGKFFLQIGRDIERLVETKQQLEDSIRLYSSLIQAAENKLNFITSSGVESYTYKDYKAWQIISTIEKDKLSEEEKMGMIHELLEE